MRVAVPVWQNRVSPVFDTARKILLWDSAGGQTGERVEVPLVEVSPALRVGRLAELGVDVLICGAISRPLGTMVQAGGIQLVPWIAGEVDEVLRAYQSGSFPTDAFMMPGCCGRRHRQRGRGRGRGNCGQAF